MKKLLLTLVLFLFIFTGYSQKYLTNAQVYNFSVGDVFETVGSSYGSPSPPLYELTKILSKKYSAKLDTIYYTDSVYTRSSNSCMTCTDSTYSAQLQSMTITNFDSSAIPAADSVTVQNCAPGFNTNGYYDTIYVDSTYYCGKKVFLREPPILSDTNNPCYEPTTYTFQVIEGCGGIYTTYYDASFTSGGATTLAYYKKHDTVCGSYHDIIAGINNVTQPAITLALYPNPASSQLNINTNSTFYLYTVTDVTGRFISSAEFKMGQPINITKLASGQYLITFFSKYSGNVVKQFTKE